MGSDGSVVSALLFWDGGGAVVPLHAPACLTIGRAEKCELHIDHGSVSRAHARLHVHDEEVAIEDLGSSNGTRVNARRIAPHEQVVLHTGDLTEIGAAVLVLREPRERRPADAGYATGGAGDPMAPLTKLVALVAQGALPVILVGETGVGKEVWARRIHEHSQRAALPFVPIHCAAIPEALLESELFGCEKGAFTGADRPRMGMLESARGGTVFLDELSEIPQRLQAKLLRALECQEIYPLGTNRPRPMRARFLSATNRSLESLVASGGFRSDLYFRLNGVTLRIPPLRERPSEVEPLAVEFATRAAESLGRKPARLSHDAVAWLKSQPWPGNIRELKNRIDCACLLCSDGPIEVRHLAPDPTAAPSPAVHREPSLWKEFEVLERQRILEALAEVKGNQSRAASNLGISRRTLISRLDQYGIDRPRKKP